MHPNHTVAYVQLTMHDSAGFVASDRSGPDVEHRNQMIMDSFDVIIDKQGQSLGETMIDFRHVVEGVQQFHIRGASRGEGIPLLAVAVLLASPLLLLVQPATALATAQPASVTLVGDSKVNWSAQVTFRQAAL
jgi:hypothetical protein